MSNTKVLYPPPPDGSLDDWRVFEAKVKGIEPRARLWIDANGDYVVRIYHEGALLNEIHSGDYVAVSNGELFVEPGLRGEALSGGAYFH